MGEEREDPQKLKRIAAAAYDYENDPKWADYWSNILIPPHMASRSDVVDHFKRKFYQRYIEAKASKAAETNFWTLSQDQRLGIFFILISGPFVLISYS